jgi:glutathione S-transferase
MYLAEKTGKFIPSVPKKYSQVIQWQMFQMSGVGPMMSQANVFYRYFREKIPAALITLLNLVYLFGSFDILQSTYLSLFKCG